VREIRRALNELYVAGLHHVDQKQAVDQASVEISEVILRRMRRPDTHPRFGPERLEWLKTRRDYLTERIRGSSKHEHGYERAEVSALRWGIKTIESYMRMRVLLEQLGRPADVDKARVEASAPAVAEHVEGLGDAGVHDDALDEHGEQ
jgi:hypothetical protein